MALNLPQPMANHFSYTQTFRHFENDELVNLARIGGTNFDDVLISLVTWYQEFAEINGYCDRENIAFSCNE